MSDSPSIKKTMSYCGVKPFRNLAMVRVHTSIDVVTAHAIANHPQKVTDDMRMKIKRDYVIVGSGPDCISVSPGDVIEPNEDFFMRPSIEYYRVKKFEGKTLIDYINKIKGSQLMITQEQAINDIDKDGRMHFEDWYYAPEYELWSIIGTTTEDDMANIFKDIEIVYPIVK